MVHTYKTIILVLFLNISHLFACQGASDQSDIIIQDLHRACANLTKCVDLPTIEELSPIQAKITEMQNECTQIFAQTQKDSIPLNGKYKNEKPFFSILQELTQNKQAEMLHQVGQEFGDDLRPSIIFASSLYSLKLSVAFDNYVETKIIIDAFGNNTKQLLAERSLLEDNDKKPKTDLSIKNRVKYEILDQKIKYIQAPERFEDAVVALALYMQKHTHN